MELYASEFVFKKREHVMKSLVKTTGLITLNVMRE